MSLSERLQKLRKKSGDSQEQLAEKLGVSRQAVSKWENGQGSPDLDNIIKISENYDVSTDYLLKGTQINPQPEPKKRPMDKSLKKALIIILIFIGIALSGVVFLSLLTFFMTRM